MFHILGGYIVGTWIGHAYFIYKYPDCKNKVPNPFGWEIVSYFSKHD